jgi:hypothetical protein
MTMPDGGKTGGGGGGAISSFVSHYWHSTSAKQKKGKVAGVGVLFLVLWLVVSLLMTTERVDDDDYSDTTASYPAKFNRRVASSSSSSSTTTISSKRLGAMSRRIIQLETLYAKLQKRVQLLSPGEDFSDDDADAAAHDDDDALPVDDAAANHHQHAGHDDGANAEVHQHGAPGSGHDEQQHNDKRYSIEKHVGQDGKEHHHHMLKFPDDVDNGNRGISNRKQEFADRPKGFASPEAECKWMGETFRVRPGLWWGELPEAGQARWRKLTCDHKFTPPPIGKLALDPSEPAARPERLPGTEHLYKDGHNPMIAIVIPTTTRNIKVHSFNALSLFHDCLPALVATVVKGFNYHVFVAYDKGDSFFDNKGKHAEITDWFAEHAVKPLAKKDITMILELQGFPNPKRKPIPVFNQALQWAYTEGADFFFRINDDTIMASPWANQFVKAMGKLGAAPYGAVGPRDDRNPQILTHDFTHRTHMDIFTPYYYPDIFLDWYIDNWITRVYGRKRTRQIAAVRCYNNGRHGTRYTPSDNVEGKLPDTLRKGGQKVLEWMKKNEVSQTAMTTYVNDSFKYVLYEDQR